MSDSPTLSALPIDAKHDNDLLNWSAVRVARLEALLTRYLDPAIPDDFLAAMRYAVCGGGKRIRALLAYAAGELTGADSASLDQVAVAVESLHAYSLVHDDLPAMDDDELRRGRPTVHIAYGEATAVLVGDALQTLAFESLADLSSLPHPPAPSCVVALVKCLARASGRNGMVSGQFIDCTSNGLQLSRSELEHLHRCKTGALLSASVLMGASVGTCSPEARAALENFSQVLGLAFQVRDDWLDASADTATLGKTAGKDAVQQKTTFVSLLGVDGAHQLTKDLLAQSLAALTPLGGGASRLASLAEFVVMRTH